MNADVLDHATRVLAAEPTRSLAVEQLYERVGPSRGPDLSLRRFIEAVALHTTRFTIVEPAPQVPTDAGWTDRDRCAYADVLNAAGFMNPRVMLAERPVDPFGGAQRDSSKPADRGDVLADVHQSLIDLVHSSAGSDALTAALTAAVHDLESVRNVLR